jgi:hypothetical protein
LRVKMNECATSGFSFFSNLKILTQKIKSKRIRQQKFASRKGENTIYLITYE